MCDMLGAVKPWENGRKDGDVTGELHSQVCRDETPARTHLPGVCRRKEGSQ